jgi:hypothetical protein
LIPIPISTPQIFVLLLLTAAIFFIALLLPAILELKKPKDAGPRKILESDGKEIVGFSVLLAVYFRENSREAKLLEDIEAPEFSLPSRGFLSIPLPDIEF